MKRIRLSFLFMAILHGLSCGIIAMFFLYPHRPDFIDAWNQFTHSPMSSSNINELEKSINFREDSNRATTHIVYFGNGVLIGFDQNEIPTQISEENGEIIPIQAEGYAKLLQLAIDTHTPQVLHYVFETNADNDNFYRRQVDDLHPLISNLPQDVLSEDEQENRGVRVISDQGQILRISASALEPGGILDVVDENHPIDIVLINGPVVSIRFASDPVYAPYQQLLETHVPKKFALTEFRQSRLDLYTHLISEEQKALNEAIETKNDSAILSHNTEIARLSGWAYVYQNISDEDLAVELVTEESNAAGLFMGADDPLIAVSPNLHGRSIVFVSTGLLPELQNTVVYIDTNGQIQVAKQIDSGFDYRTTNQLSHPSKGDYAFNAAASADNPKNQYPYAAQDLNTTLRHELLHYRHWRTGLPQIEFAVDTESMATIDEAYIQWEQEGDDSLMPFYWLLPDGDYTQTKILGKDLL